MEFTRLMHRIIEEAEYVLAVLLHMRDQVAADPTLFDADAQKRIDEAIARTENVIRFTRPQLEASFKGGSKAA